MPKAQGISLWGQASLQRWSVSHFWQISHPPYWRRWNWPHFLCKRVLPKGWSSKSTWRVEIYFWRNSARVCWLFCIQIWIIHNNITFFSFPDVSIGYNAALEKRMFRAQQERKPPNPTSFDEAERLIREHPHYSWILLRGKNQWPIIHLLEVTL